MSRLSSRPTTADLVAALTDRLVEDRLPYALGGAQALRAWGVARPTSPLELVVFVGEAELGRLFEAIERGEAAVVDRDQARRTVAETGQLSVRFSRTRVGVALAYHPIHDDMERRRVPLPTPDGKQRWFLSAEDLAITKLVSGRPKDAADVERLFAAQQAKLDAGYVRDWLGRILPPRDRRHARLAALARRYA